MDATAQEVVSGKAAWAVECAEAAEGLRRLPAGCVQCVCTSPPYYGLRTYLPDGHPDKAREIGLEETPDAYVARLVEMFGEVKRVLRDDGVLWVNCGDSYAGGAGGRGDVGRDIPRPNGTAGKPSRKHAGTRITRPPAPGLKAKDLIGAPWMVAFALRADGWYLRAAITWCKVNTMPESVRDRPTRATEMVFLLTKRAAYFYDQEAERVAYSDARGGDPGYVRPRPEKATGPNARNGHSQWETGRTYSNNGGRNLWDWWGDIRPEPYPDAHFATFPPDLPRRCLRLGTSEKGACPACGAPWRRIRGPDAGGTLGASWHDHADDLVTGNAKPTGEKVFKTYRRGATLGWRPSCACPPADPVPCLCLDPFAGSGTTGMVARRLGRRFVGLDLNPEYVALARRRIAEDNPLFNAAPPAPPPAPGLFDAITPEAPDA